MHDSSASPFHAGEQAVQTRLGVREKMERFGRQVIRDHLPEQHREFYRQLPFILVGHADRCGWPWASMLFDQPGFVTSPDPGTLHINARPLADDPLSESLSAGMRLGLLGIELHTRRRNRVSGHITAMPSGVIQLAVDQAFGNCPQYIQTRTLDVVEDETPGTPGRTDLHALDDRARRLIQSADTFFVASYVTAEAGTASEGVDVSHRGGRPGFVRIDADGRLTIPDYAGNSHFNTLGNFMLNPRAGLLFIDFEKGDLLTLTGTVEILWESPETEYFAGAERLWRFTVDHGRYLGNALPLRWTFDEYSPNTLLTGTWRDAGAQRAADADRPGWREYRVVRIEQESRVIRSFYLQPSAGALPSFEAGQFMTLRLTVNGQALKRTYTLSSAPADPLYRISIKREPGGVVSNHLHDSVRVGDVLLARAPSGRFTFNAADTRPAVLLSAGVGITPMLSMVRHAVHEHVRTRHLRKIVFIHAAADSLQRAFFDEVRALVARSGGQIKPYSVLGLVDAQLMPGRDFHHTGRITREFLQSALPLDDYDFYLCGPAGFMQSMYDSLLALGIRDRRILAESFSTASLQRRPETLADAKPGAEEAIEALVEFRDSAFQQAWSSESGTLLEFAERHGLSPAHGCRNGSCGACRTQLVSGDVTYRQTPGVALAPDEVLLCCAVPAAPASRRIARVTLSL